MSEAVGTTAAPLDVIAIGRASVDLYGQQIGSRLEDVASFAKSVGGCPANIAVGTARLGLRSALLSRVGDEQMGRFIREQLVREGVSVEGLGIDPGRLTALVLLSVEDEGVSPMIFYRTDCADMALSEEDVDEAFVASARAVVVTGTHFSRPGPAAAQRKAMRIVKANGGRVVFDIDYRPNLWGLAGHAEGFGRYVRSDRVSAEMQAVLPDCDLIVGTEEEVLIASGETDLLAALKTIRSLSQATIVLKRARWAASSMTADQHDLEDGIVGDGFPIEVYNVLGAGDAFMSGFLRGWLGGESLGTAATWANACGAFAVSRLLCSPNTPPSRSFGSSSTMAVRTAPCARTRPSTTFTGPPPGAGGYRRCGVRLRPPGAVEAAAQKAGADFSRIDAFKVLAVKAAVQVAGGREGYGMLIDENMAARRCSSSPHPFSWLGRPVELPGSRPLRFEFSQDMGSQLVEWPVGHCIKCLCFYHPDDPPELKAEQQQKLRALFEAARKVGRELLIEIIAGKHGPLDPTTVPRALDELYALGIRPDWWKLEPQASAAAWADIEATVRRHDPWCRGVVLLGLEAPQDELEAAFAATADAPIVKGFAVGRTIFSHAAEEWFAGRMTDEAAVADMASRFRQLTEAWLGARGRKAA